MLLTGGSNDPTGLKRRRPPSHSVRVTLSNVKGAVRPEKKAFYPLTKAQKRSLKIARTEKFYINSYDTFRDIGRKSAYKTNPRGTRMERSLCKAEENKCKMTT